MTNRIAFAALLMFVLLLQASAPAAEKIRPMKIGAKAPEIKLADFRGREWTWKELRGEKVTVVAFLGTECPLVQQYAKRLNDLAAKFESQGVKLIGVNSNQHDSLAEIEHFVRTHKLQFPMLKDPGNRIADAFGAERTPEIFVLDRDQRLQYRGRVDDQFTYGLQRPKVTRAHLKESVEELLAGKKVSVPETETVGCHIGRLLEPDTESEITYSNQVSRILQKRCVSCHRPGEIGPFALMDYEEVVGWAEMIKEVVSEKRMPPWHADPKHSLKFSNDSSLTKQELDTLVAWVDAGAPEGDPKQLPKPVKFSDGWQIGKPDAVFAMSKRAFQVPAKDEVKYKYFVVDPGFKEDMWIKAAECRPGNRAVVHHIIVAARPKSREGARQQGVHGTPRSAWISATAPGAPPQIFPPGTAKRIPAGWELVFQLHYTPNGTPQEDISSVGFIYADKEEVKQEVATLEAVNNWFEIPPRADNHEVKSKVDISRDTNILTLFPHMHLRGKSFKYVLEYPKGSGKADKVLLDVPQYDFNWQNGYRLEEPFLAPAGSVVRCIAHFDNSEDNLANPAPEEKVKWGDQTWEEMMIGYFDVVIADQKLDLTKQPETRAEKFLRLHREKPLEAARFAAGLERSLESQNAIRAFGGMLLKRMPQLDRMDYSYVENGKVFVDRVAQQTGGRPRSFTAEASALAKYAREKKLVVHESLNDVEGEDLQLYSRFFGSSIHLPYERDGKTGLISFWSTEEKAFPPEAVELLKQIVAGE